MDVYADTLVFTNAVVDYVLLSLAASWNKRRQKPWRMTAGAVLGGLYSLVIFLPYSSRPWWLLCTALVAGVCVFVAFGFVSWRLYLKTLTAYLLATLLYGGGLTVWAGMTHTPVVTVRNTVVYWRISVTELLAASGICYGLLRLSEWILHRVTPQAKRCAVRFERGDRTVELTAMIDSGHELTDPYANRPVLITDAKTAARLLPESGLTVPVLLPCQTVTGSGTMDAYVVTNVCIGHRTWPSALLAVSHTAMQGDYSVIVSPNALEETA